MITRHVKCQGKVWKLVVEKDSTKRLAIYELYDVSFPLACCPGLLREEDHRNEDKSGKSGITGLAQRVVPHEQVLSLERFV